MAEKMKISVTKNYRLFQRSDKNRPLDLDKHRKLSGSMKRYGFLPEFPIITHRNAAKQLIVKDGQHRLAIAEELDLPVYWVEASTDFDVAVINSTAKIWAVRDYAQTHAANGLKAYQEGLDFADEHGLPVGVAFAMLGGVVGFTNVQRAYIDGTFKIKDRHWAETVAGIYVPLCDMSPAVKNSRFLEACMAACRVDEFDPKRLLHSADRCREKLQSYSTRDAYLSMLEEIYNFSRQKLFALKMAATMAMRARNAAKTKIHLNGKKAVSVAEKA